VAVLGNMAAVPLFFGIQILLGSVVPTLTLLCRRGWWSVAIASVASLYTWKLWGHPWAIVIFSAEALWLAVFVNRFNGPPRNDLNGRIILINIAYWLLIGTPLVIFFYSGVLQFDAENVAVSAAKQSLNGVANTVGAFLIFVLLQVWRSSKGTGLVPLRGVVFSLVLASITIPSLILTLLSGNQLQTTTQEGVLENLRTVGEAAARIAHGQIGDPSKGLPASIGSVAFLRTDDDGTRITSNPDLFRRLELDFQPANAGQIKVEGLQILIPKGKRPALRTWVQGYWTTSVNLIDQTVLAVQPARPEVLKLQAQSATLLTTLNWVLLLGALLSELVASLLEGQFRLLRTSEKAVARIVSPSGRQPTLPETTDTVRPREGTVIAEIHVLAWRLHEQVQEQARLRQELEALGARLEHSTGELRQLSSTDPLTGAFNRSELEPRLKHLAERALACTVPLCCLAFGVKGLREINAIRGRPEGDDVLRQLIARLKILLHANDSLFRIGGTEFLLLLWDQPLESARTMAERILLLASEANLPPSAISPPPLRMYAGVSMQRSPDPSGGEAMLSRVEQALNQARTSGANQVVTR